MQGQEGSEMLEPEKLSYRFKKQIIMHFFGSKHRETQNSSTKCFLNIEFLIDFVSGFYISVITKNGRSLKRLFRIYFNVSQFR